MDAMLSPLRTGGDGSGSSAHVAGELQPEVELQLEKVLRSGGRKGKGRGGRAMLRFLSTLNAEGLARLGGSVESVGLVGMRGSIASKGLGSRRLDGLGGPSGSVGLCRSEKG